MKGLYFIVTIKLSNIDAIDATQDHSLLITVYIISNTTVESLRSIDLIKT